MADRCGGRYTRAVVALIAVVLVSMSVGSQSRLAASAQSGTRSGGSVTPRPGTAAATPSAQCPNLSGRYTLQGEDGQVKISIDQQGCETVRIVRERGYLGTVTTETHSLTLDGKVRTDSTWFGGSGKCCQTFATFVGSTLHVQARAADGTTTTLSYALNAQRDLLEGALLNGRGADPVVAKRQK